jgi:hypothetical protein
MTYNNVGHKFSLAKYVYIIKPKGNLLILVIGHATIISSREIEHDGQRKRCPFSVCGEARGMKIYLDVDISHLARTIAALKEAHSQKEFELLMYRAFQRTGQRVRTILKTDLPHEYKAKPAWIGQNVGNARTQIGGTNGSVVSCTIPLKGARGTMGAGQKFHAAGPRGRRGKKAYKITAQVVKTGNTVLPDKMPTKTYGGQPPFLTAAGKIKKGIVFTRKTKNRLPIIRVAAIGVPQMPMNRSADDVQDEIADTLFKRMEHEHARLIDRCR